MKNTTQKVTQFRNKRIKSFLKDSYISSQNSSDYILSLEILKKIEALYEDLIVFEEQLMEKRFNISHKKEFFHCLNSYFRYINKAEKSFSNKIAISKLKNLFRNINRRFFFKSLFAKHGYLKPSGYPGDYRIIEAMYDKIPISKGIGFYFDQYFLNDIYVNAVRDRKDFMKYYLVEYIKRNQNGGWPLNVLNIACGSCREIREGLKQGLIPQKQKVNFMLVDQDRETLRFAKEKIKNIPRNLNFEFIAENVANFYQKKRVLAKRFKKQNLIYSIGLVDYLPDSIFVPMIRFCFGLLKNNGELIIAHKNIEKIPAPVADWICDWKFYPRDSKRVSDLVKSALLKRKYVESFLGNKNDLVFYVILRKKLD